MTDQQKREIVRLRLEHKTQKEIATVMGVTPSAIDWVLRQAGVPKFHVTNGQISTLTKEQIAKIQTLDGVVDHKTVARRFGCTPSQVKHYWRMIERRKKGTYVHALSPAAQALLHQRACATLREVVEGARAERATAPLFRIRPEEWA